MKVGSVIRVTEAYSSELPKSADNPNLVTDGDVLWAIVTRIDDSTAISVEWLDPEKIPEGRYGVVPYLTRKFDRFKCVAPKLWPDWVCAEVAKRALLGRDEEGL